MIHNLRAVLVGQAGTGKTTLSTKLSTLHNWNLISEVFRDVCSAYRVHSLDDVTPEQMANLQIWAMKEQIRREDALYEQGFIGDRSVYDNLFYTRAQCKKFPHVITLNEKMVQEHISQRVPYHLIVYVPPFDNDFEPEQDGFRRSNAQKINEYVAKECLKIADYVLLSKGIDERVDEMTDVLQKIEKRGLTSDRLCG